MPSGAIFLSGSGTNAEKILSQFGDPAFHRGWVPKVLVTDRPKTSRARIIAEKYGLPLIEHGLAAFYRQHGLDSVSLATEEGRRVRDLWTAALREKLAEYRIDFGILAGFVSLTNLAASLPCLNVHPGDLTYRKDGRRYLTGLHTIPVELAILEGLDHLRCSVILVRPFSGNPDEVDSGHILGISDKVPLDLQGHSPEELRTIFRNRKHAHIHGANRDLLFDLANHNQERLKFAGDHAVYPEVIDDFARGRFTEADDGGLLYDGEPVETVEYHADGTRTPLKK
ncbi:MAG: hypothetical protein IJS14_02515 [Lentisphaeria bacterium]|nr:hypothetical protein [Lentisphaeria bacterium]